MLRPETVRGYQDMVYGIYGEYNDRNYQDPHLMMRLWEVIAVCLEALRKERYQEVVAELPHIFSWLCSFCNRHKIDLTEVTWQKYPNICPYGLEEQNCVCMPGGKKYDPTTHELLRFRNDRRNMPTTIRGFQDMFRRIYGPINSVQTIGAALNHIAEEIGEISRAYRLGRREEMEAEIADAFAWLCALATRLSDGKRVFEKREEPLELEELIWQQYPGVCDACEAEKCKCPEPAIRGF